MSHCAVDNPKSDLGCHDDEPGDGGGERGADVDQLECNNNSRGEVRRLTLPHFQHHLHALGGAHPTSHAVQALPGPV